MVPEGIKLREKFKVCDIKCLSIRLFDSMIFVSNGIPEIHCLAFLESSITRVFKTEKKVQFTCFTELSIGLAVGDSKGAVHLFDYI